MKTASDIFLLEKSMDFSIQILEVSKLLPKYETFGITQIMKDCTINQSTYVQQYFNGGSNDEKLFYLDNAKGLMRRMTTILEISYRLNYININDRNDFCGQLDMILEIIESKIHALEEELEKERLNLTMSLSGLTEMLPFQGRRRMDS